MTQKLTLPLLIGLMLFGCAEERAPINRVQPNALEKSQFDGEWYYVRTVVDVPAANGFTFVGNTDHSGMTKVTWDIQEDVLYARRSTELIKGSDAKNQEGTDYKGEVVAAFNIQSHFDIINAYNPTTGEQLNIVEENTTDRPWYERKYIRVDWSQNLVTNYQLDFEAASAESVPYYVQEFDEAGKRNPDAPVFEKDYFDVTNKLFAKAGTIEFPGYGELPLCWLRGEEFTECGAGEYTIRHSFKRIDPGHQYEALAYKGKSTEIFGFFTTDRTTYDPKEGILEQNKERYINRHNLWVKWRDNDGNLIPYAQRELRPIVYHVNRDMPDDIKPMVLAVGDQWNKVFTDVVKSLGYEPKGRVFIACPNNPIEEGDAPECGPVGSSPRLGDIRYSFMAYVPKYMTYGLLGLGPSNNDPETGEIISGMAYVYHHNNLAAFQVEQTVELLNGTRDPNSYIDGVDLGEWVDQVNGVAPTTKRTFDLKDADYMVSKIANTRASRWEGHRHQISQADIDFQKANGFQEWIKPFKQQIYDRGILNGSKTAPDAKLAALKDTYIEDLMLDPEILMAGGHQPGTEVLPIHIKQASIARGGLGKLMAARGRLREQFAASRNMYLPEMADDAMMGLARQLKDADPDTVFNTVRTSIYTAVLAHEVGHSLGLMHNFGGSDDALNYHDEYWKIRDDGLVASRLTDPITDTEINANLYNYAYSSIMDYAGRYTIDGLGVGKYDRAAMLFGYAEKVEVYKDNGDVPHEELRDWYERSGDVFYFTLQPRHVHYTSYYNRMGDKLYSADNRELVDVKDLSADWSESEVDGKMLTRVPYIYCSHSRANLGDSCLTRDYGADSMERMKNILDDLDTWYIARSFPRGKVGVDSFGYVGRYYSRIYDRLKKWHDIYGLYTELLAPFYGEEGLKAFLTNSESGWGPQTWAVENAFNYLVRTLLTPNIGTYGGPYLMPDGNVQMELAGSQGGTNLDVAAGARYYSTSWGDGDRECGYMWWECLHHVGYYLDKVMAIEALSDSKTNFVARTSPEDLRQWEVSYYNTFSEQIGRISQAIMSQNWSTVGPYLQNGALVFPNYAGALSQGHQSPVNPFATFSIQLYWEVMGQARFHDNYDQSFVDENRVFILGTGTEPALEPSQMTTFTDPASGLRYGSIKFPGKIGSATAVLDRANKMKSTSNFCDNNGATPEASDDCDPNANQQTRDYVDSFLIDHIELIKIMADLSPMMSFGSPYNP